MVKLLSFKITSINDVCKVLLLLSWLVLQFSPQTTYAQNEALHSIKGLPTKEVYDLLVDQKGLLWIGHDQGLSSYDGKAFQHYTNAQQTSLAVSDLLEDKWGRIWCHNFNGQIFYVEQGRMKLLEEYDYNSEVTFPRIVLVNDELVATSKRGLFICDLNNKKSRYIDLPPHGIGSLAVTKNKVVAIGKNQWFIYEKGKVVAVSQSTFYGRNKKAVYLWLQPVGKGDTVFAIANPESVCIRFKIEGTVIKPIDTLKSTDFINTLTIDNNQCWIHSKSNSINIRTKEKLKGFNLTDIVNDKEGNFWLSSLNHGLLVKYANDIKKIDPAIPLRKDDYVRTVTPINGHIVFGTNSGEVFIKDLKSNQTKHVFHQKGEGAIERIYPYDNSHILICPSIGFYLLDLKTLKIRQLIKNEAIKSLSFNTDYIAIGATANLLLMPSPVGQKREPDWKKSVIKQFSFLKAFSGNDSLLKAISQRCRAVSFVPFNNSLLVSFKNGLFLGNDKGLHPVMYKGKQLNALALLPYQDKVFIGTIAAGLLVYDKNGVHQIENDNLEFFGAIQQLKLLDNKLWIIGSQGLQILDPYNESNSLSYQLPSIYPGNVLDVDEFNSHVWLTTTDGIYQMSSKQSKIYKPKIFLSNTIVNGTDTLQGNNHHLTYRQSSIRFDLIAPWYSNPDAVYISYRLLGSADTSWQYSTNSTLPINYTSLKPGNYLFEAKVILNGSNVESTVIKNRFVIEKPYWQRVSFWILMTLLLLSLVIYLLVKHYKFRLKRQRLYYEKELAIEKERKRISADIHDELGASLSGIKLMAEMTGQKYKTEELIEKDLDHIYTSLSNLSHKMREVIWSLNSENDSLENLLVYMNRRGKEMFAHSTIHFRTKLPKDIPYIELHGDQRKHIYLAVMEAMHNSLKHANGTLIELKLSITKSKLIIVVQDDGIGFDVSFQKEGNGLRNMQQRLLQVNGQFLVEADKGTKVSMEIPLA